VPLRSGDNFPISILTSWEEAGPLNLTTWVLAFLSLCYSQGRGNLPSLFWSGLLERSWPPPACVYWQRPWWEPLWFWGGLEVRGDTCLLEL
jgi:hypothetical protein